MRRTTSIALSTVSFAALALMAAPAAAQTPDTVAPNADPCAAPATQVDKAQCPDTAQQTPDQTVTQDVVPGQADSGQEILVTGSRIRRDAYNTGENITVINRQEATQAGFNSTTETLQSNAVTTGTAQINNAFGGFVTDGGPGANTVSLRGLGPSRTLVLLNGRRIAPAGTRGSIGSADLNVLPTSIVDRVEILKAGASSIYGSDAVAGVINVITRTNVRGLTLEAQTNIPENGAGESYRVAAVGGYKADNWYLSGTVEYYKRNELTVGDVDWTQCQTDYIRTASDRRPGSGDFIDPATGRPKCYTITGTGTGGVSINTLGLSTRAAVGAPGSTSPGALGNFNRFRPNANVTTGVVGFEGVGGGTNSLNVRDTFDPDILNNSLISPARNLNGFLQGGVDIAALGDAQVYFELLGTRRKSEQTGYRQLSLDYAVGDPRVPAALQGGAVFLPAGASEVTNGRATQARLFIGYGNTKNFQKVDFVRAGGGIRGDFVLPDWNYDFYLGKTWTDSKYTSESFLTDRVRNSLDLTLCAATAGCVAAPAITPAVIGGDLPQAYRDYILQPVTGTTQFREFTASVGFDGSVIRLPGGDLGVFVGGEYRKSRIDDTPPEDSINGNLYNLTSATPTRGTDSVWEVFGEVELPILRRIPAVYDLTVNGSVRYTNYKSYGGSTTYKLSGQYSPDKWLSFRGNYGTSYRAPALFEQFLGATSGFLSQQSDPCNNFGALPAGSFRAANCAAEGLDPNHQATSSIRVLTAGGRESGLEAETSKSWSVGAVLQPSFGRFGDLSFAVDYFDTRVENGVSRAGAGNILSLCYDDPQFRAGGSFCRLVTRAAGTNALTVNNNYVNLATDIVKGIDFNLRHQMQLGGGTFRIGAQVTHYTSQASRLFADDPLDDINGTVAAPAWSGTFDTSYKLNRWTLRYGLDWIDGTDSYEYFGLNEATTPFYFETKDYFLHNASVQWEGDAITVIAGVRNMFDKEPPQISYGAYNRIGNAPLYSGYDYLGRTFFVNFTAGLDKLGNKLGL